jgi:hypothetical protein
MSDLVQKGNMIFSAFDLTKVYKMGEVQVQALRGVDLELVFIRTGGHAWAVRQR